MKIHFYILLFIGLFILACESTFEFENLPSQEYIVVDGIVSDQLGKSRVLITGSSNFDPSATNGRAITNAQVTILDQNGNETVFSNKSASNLYIPPSNFQGSLGMGYQLIVNINGKSIKSTVEIINETTPYYLEAEYTEIDILTDANTVAARYGHNMYAQFISPIEQNLFIKWSWEGNYEHPYTYKEFRNLQLGFFNLTATTDLIEAGVERFNIAFIINQNLTWQEPQGFMIDVADLEPDDYKGPLNDMTVDTILDSLTFVNNTTPRKEFEFVVSVLQQSLTSEAYRYWEKVLEQKQNTGSIFDGFPNTINGNLSSEDSEEIILGYFSAVSTTERTFPLYYFADKP